MWGKKEELIKYIIRMRSNYEFTVFDSDEIIIEMIKLIHYLRKDFMNEEIKDMNIRIIKYKPGYEEDTSEDEMYEKFVKTMV